MYRAVLPKPWASERWLLTGSVDRSAAGWRREGPIEEDEAEDDADDRAGRVGARLARRVRRTCQDAVGSGHASAEASRSLIGWRRPCAFEPRATR